MSYTYDESILSDLHKDARGFRPRENFWNHWNACTDAERQQIWDDIVAELEFELNQVREQEARAVTDFEERINEITRVMMCDRDTAIRIWVDSLGLTGLDREYGASWICFEANLPFSMASTFVDAGVSTHIG